MADIVAPEKRSAMMARVRGKDTRPEMMIRRALHGRGFRYRLHVKELPGRPDLVLPKYRAVIQIHGCFWHGHDCALFRWPSTRAEFWRAKIGGNRARDVAARATLLEKGWRLIEIWECALKGKTALPLDAVAGRISGWLTSEVRHAVIEGIRDGHG